MNALELNLSEKRKLMQRLREETKKLKEDEKDYKERKELLANNWILWEDKRYRLCQPRNRTFEAA